ncbi:MAG: substrate-binding domain-containing protein [Pirellulaceae bacterium]
MERGFKHLAYCGDPGFNWSNWRKERFRESVESSGLVAHVLIRCPAPIRNIRGRAKKGPRFVDQPSATSCRHFRLLRHPSSESLGCLQELDIAVPEEVAVLGVDNDPVLCELADPPLSSVICNVHRTGFEAASLLDRMMHGEQVDSKPVLVEPTGIQTRQSTDVLAITDPDVAIALRFIRENALAGINVSDVVRQVPLSRRILESRFRKAIGRSPHDEITRLRLDRVKELLLETDLPLSQIASRTGFEHTEYLTVFFRKAVGVPPSSFRASHAARAVGKVRD